MSCWDCFIFDRPMIALAFLFQTCFGTFEITSILMSLTNLNPGLDLVTDELVLSLSSVHVPIAQNKRWQSTSTENVCCHHLWQSSFLSYERFSYSEHLRSEGISQRVLSGLKATDCVVIWTSGPAPLQTHYCRGPASYHWLWSGCDPSARGSQAVGIWGSARQ